MGSFLFGTLVGAVAAFLIVLGFAFRSMATGSRTYGGLRVRTVEQISNHIARIGLELKVKKADEIEGEPESFATVHWYMHPLDAVDFGGEIVRRGLEVLAKHRS